MFSKLAKSLILLLVILAAASCHRLVGEKTAMLPTPKNKIGSEARCISDSTPVIKSFFSGEATAVDIRAAWICYESALDLFSKKVRGANPNFYHAAEITDFIEAYFITDGTKLGDGLMTEFLRLKQFLVGGREDRVTREELKGLHDLTRQFSILMVDLLPYMKVYSERWQMQNTREAARADFATAELEFNQRLVHAFPKLTGSYDLKNLKGLAKAIVQAFPDSEGFSGFQKGLEKYLPAVIAVTNIILNDTTSLVQGEDLPVLMRQLPSLYGRYLFVQYFLKDDWFWGEGLTDFDIFVRQSLDCLRRVLQTRWNGDEVGIQIDELSRLADGVGQAELLGPRFTGAALKSIVPVLVKRLLTPPEQRLNGKVEQTLNSTSIRTFIAEYEAFLVVQQRLDQLFRTTPSWNHALLQTAFQGEKGALAELARMIESPLPKAFDNQSRLFFHVSKEIPYTKASVLKLNATRAIARLAIRSYALDEKRVQDLLGLTKTEFQNEMFTDFRPLLVGAGLIDADNLSFARNRFVEASLFTPLANGDETMDFQEGTAITLMIWSGINVNSELEIRKNCLIGPGSPEYLAACAMEQMRVDVPMVTTSMPLMGAALAAMSQPDGHKVMMDLLVTSGWEDNGIGSASASDIGLVPHVLQYIESVYRRWDLNHDGLIDKNETMAAEPIFRPLLASVSGNTDPQILRAAFAYIVAYQKNPTDDLWGFLDFASDESKWVISVDRAGVGRILGFIADQLRKNPVAVAQNQ